MGIHKRICQLLTSIRSEKMLSFHPESHVELQLQKVRLNLRHREYVWRNTKERERTAQKITCLSLESMLHRGADQIQWSLQQSTTLSTTFARHLKHFFVFFCE